MKTSGSIRNDPGMESSESAYGSRLGETLPRVREEIARAAEAGGRDAASVTLVAVTKGHPLAAASAAIAGGLSHLGENRVEALEARVEALGRDGIRWHMVGHLQRRKAPRALAVCDLLHSLDSSRLAERISRVAEEEVDVLFQVNTSGEEAKYGFDRENALERILEAASLPHIRARGLMTMAPLTDDEGVLRRTFRRLRELRDGLREEDPGFGVELSMGMSNDLSIAVEEGSTMVRIGTALFGPRDPG